MPTVLSLEQALALPYATQRFVQLGWRVIRIESPAEDGGGNPGDPNRYIGVDLGFPDLHSYYIAPNVGKEAITINLKKQEGRELLGRIIKELNVDVFMCATLPKRYRQLGIDYETLRKYNPSLIWCGISAMGPDYPDRAGYDPALQAMLGFTYLTGEANGMPVPCGIPVIDLKAGDEAFTQVLLALLEQKHLSPNPSPKERGGIPGYHTTDSQMWNLLQEKALEMRKNPTTAEMALWQTLRRNATKFYFRRQHIIDRFIVDFVCLKKGLVVEVDGDIHDYKKEEDELRTQILNERGLKVVRFRNEKVLANADGVVDEIIRQLKNQPDYKVLPFGEDLGGVGEGAGDSIHISMAQCAASWLITALPQLEFVKSDDELFKRSGNEHRSFIPCNVYPTKDGYVYLAIGNDSQWVKFTSVKGFEHLATPGRKTNAGRMNEKEKIYREIGEKTKKYSTSEFLNMCLNFGLSAAPVNSIKDVAALEFVRKNLIKTKLSSGRKINLFPPSYASEFLRKNNFALSCSPRLGEHNVKILKEAGLQGDEIGVLKADKII
ncbi:MAG: CoA transferase [Bacteroidetes bacterium]|nr:CoA transferase [Bacteroidota bacterium]